jgi:hypothetical protein
VAQDIFSTPGTSATPTNFAAINLAGLNIDSLVISFQTPFNQTHLIDNIALSPTVIPIPAAIWFMGSGLIGLIGMRRKALKLSTLSA